MPVEIVVKSVLGVPVSREIVFTVKGSDQSNPSADIFYLVGGAPHEILKGHTGKVIEKLFAEAEGNLDGNLYD